MKTSDLFQVFSILYLIFVIGCADSSAGTFPATGDGSSFVDGGDSALDQEPPIHVLNCMLRIPEDPLKGVEQVYVEYQVPDRGMYLNAVPLPNPQRLTGASGGGYQPLAFTIVFRGDVIRINAGWTRYRDPSGTPDNFGLYRYAAPDSPDTYLIRGSLEVREDDGSLWRGILVRVPEHSVPFLELRRIDSCPVGYPLNQRSLCLAE